MPYKDCALGLDEIHGTREHVLDELDVIRQAFSYCGQTVPYISFHRRRGENREYSAVCCEPEIDPKQNHRCPLCLYSETANPDAPIIRKIVRAIATIRAETAAVASLRAEGISLKLDFEPYEYETPSQEGLQRRRVAAEAEKAAEAPLHEE